jgi:hypothetical protein
MIQPLIPPLPKDYDVEKTSHFSAGHIRPTKKPAKAKGVPNTTATYGNEADATDPPPQGLPYRAGRRLRPDFGRV